jgi:4-hydroxy-tetrahydrodipicolinate reductase
LGSDFDIEIIEKHHNQKIDAPSGTALMIAEEISDYMSEKPEYVYDRSKTRKPRSKNEIGIHSVRGGNICGDHEVMFSGSDEIITLAHHASSRDIFASGALKAAKFLADCAPGLYTMKNMIGNM